MQRAQKFAQFVRLVSLNLFICTDMNAEEKQYIYFNGTFLFLVKCSDFELPPFSIKAYHASSKMDTRNKKLANAPIKIENKTKSVLE